MRRFPSSWKTVLAQLGFKRKRRKLPEGRGRRSRLESLESRELLSVSPGIDENPPLVDEVAAASPGPLPVPVAFGEAYTILESEARSLFEVTTARDADGGGYALLSWKEGAAPEAGVTYKFTIESRLGSTVTGRQAVTVWLPTQEFVDALDTGRSEEAERPATTKAATPGATNISVALGSTRGYAPTVDDAKLRATAGLAAALTPGQLSKADTLQLYADLETALNTPRPADPLKALEGDDLGDAAVLLTDQLKADLASPDADVRAAAGAVLDRLPSAVNQRFYAWSGLGVNSPVHTHDVSEGRWSGSMYEAGELRLNGELAVDLDRAAIVATLATTLTAASAVSAPVYVGGSVTGAAVLADTYVDEGAPSTQFGDAATLLVQATAGNTDKEALIRLDLSGDEFTQYTTSATLTLPYTVSGPDTAYNAAEILDTHSWDGSASWDENATWDTPVPQNNPASNPDHQIEPWGVYGTGTLEIELDEHVRRQLRRSDMDFSGENTSDQQGKLGDIRAFELAIHDAASYQAAYADKAADASDITDRGDFNGDGQITEHDGAAFLANRGVLPGDFNADGTVGPDDLSALSGHLGQPGSFEDGDADFNGKVESSDISNLSGHFGLSLSAPVAEELSLRIYGTEGDPEVAYNSRENSGDSPTLDAEHGWDLQLQKLDLDATGSLRVTYNQLNQALTSIEVTLYSSEDGVTQGQQVVPTYSLTDLNPGIAKEAQIDYDPNLLAAGEHLIAVISGVGGSGDELQSDNNEAAFGDWRVGSIQVSTLVDDDDGDYSAGDLSLREALALAAALNGDDTISFNQELTGGTIELLHGELEIHSNVSVEGLGAQLLTIDAGADPWAPGRVLSVASSATATIAGVTIAGGYLDDNGIGGGVYNAGDLTLDSVTVRDNYADSGGGVLNYDTGDLTLDSVTVRDNDADLGGGVFNTGDLTLDSVTVRDNDADLGGGVFNTGDLTLDSVTVRDNDADLGGGVFNTGDLTLDSVTIRDNDAAVGGGVFNYDTGDLTLDSVTVRDNDATTGGGVWSSGDLVITGSLFQGNKAADPGSSGEGGAISSSGALLSITDTTIADNSAELDAGGVQFSGQTLSIVRSSITGNKVIQSDSALGGGVRVSNATEVTIDSSLVANNYGGESGGVWVSGVQDTLVQNTTISGNTAVNDSPEQAGGLMLTNSHGQVINSTIAYNHVYGFDELGPNRAGGLLIAGASTVELHNSIVAENTDTQGPNDLAGTLDATSSYNLIGDPGSAANLTDGLLGNLVGDNGAVLDPGLEPLGNYGGPTETHALLPDSPAIDAGGNDAAAGLVNDQRAGAHGVVERVVDGNDDGAAVVDIGAVEYGATVIKADERFLVTKDAEGAPSLTQAWSWVSTNANGDSVTVWIGDGEEGHGVYVQHINAATAGASLPRLVGLGTASTGVDTPRVAVDGQGNYVVAWIADDPETGASVIWMRRYLADGAPIDALPVQVTDTASFTPLVEVNEAGQIVLAWKSGDDLYTRRYTTSGLSLDSAPRLAVAALGLPIDVSTSGRTVAVAADGSYYLQWEQDETLYLQAYSAAGAARGQAIVVASSTDETLGIDDLPTGADTVLSRTNTTHDILVDPTGGVLVAWSALIEGSGSDGEYSKTRLLVRHVSADGQLGEAFTVTEGYYVDVAASTEDPSTHYSHLALYLATRPALAIDSEGRAGFVWQRLVSEEFEGHNYELSEPEVDEYGNTYRVPVLADGANPASHTASLETLIRWFTLSGESITAAPVVVDATSASLSADSRGTFVLTSIGTDDKLYAQRYQLPSQTSFANGVLTIGDSAAMGLDDIIVSTLRVDGDRYVAINGVATDVLAASVTRLVVTGSAAGNRIDLSRVDGAYFTSLLVDPTTLMMPIEVYAGDGADDVTASPLGGSYYGEGGEDQLSGSIGVDYLYGGDGADMLSGAEGDDELFGEAGDDLLLGNSGDDTLKGGDDDDQLDGGTGTDQLWGNSGNDRLDGGQRSTDPGDIDILHGGAGDDVFVVTASSAAVIGITDDGGNDTMDFSASTRAAEVDLSVESGWTLGAEVGSEDEESVDVNIFPLVNPLTIENVVGTDLNDVITGNGGDNRLYGGGGNDTIDGGGGNDVLLGGLGDDTYLVSIDTASEISLQDAGGEDTLSFAAWDNGEGGVRVDYGDPDNLQAINVDGDVLLETAGLFSIETVIGSSKDDTFVGPGYGVTILGGAGSDALDSYGPDDFLDGEAGVDSIDELLDEPTSTTAAWAASATGGFNGLQQEIDAAAATADDEAEWSFTGLTAGEYEVYVTWRVNPEDPTAGASEAAFTVAGETILVDQSFAPQGELLGGVTWAPLLNPATDSKGRFVVDSAGVLTVELSAAATGGMVYADAVRVVRHNQAPTVEVTSGSLEVAAGTDLSVGLSATDPDGVSVDYTYALIGGAANSGTPDGITIANNGTDNGVGAATISWPAAGRPEGAFTVLVAVTDENGAGATTYKKLTLEVGGANVAPSFTGYSAVTGGLQDQTAPDLFTADEGVEIAFNVDATDAGTLTYSLSPEAPAGADVDSGSFTWTPTEEQSGQHTFDIYITDDGSPPLRVVKTVTIDVAEDASNDLPEFVAGSVTLRYGSSSTPYTGYTDYGTVADTTIVGEVDDARSLDLVDVVFKYNADFSGDEFDDSATIAIADDGKSGTFRFAPAASTLESVGLIDHPDVMNEQVIRVYARTREWNPETEEYDYGSTVSLVFAADAAVNQPPTIDEFHLANDNGSDPDDLVTSDPSLAGLVSNPDGPAGGLTVKIYDHSPTAASTPIAQIYTEEDGSFSWTPSVAEAETWTTVYAVAEESPQQADVFDSDVASDPVPLPVTYQAPTPPQITITPEGNGAFSAQLTVLDAPSTVDGWTLSYAVTPGAATEPPTTAGANITPDENGELRFLVSDVGYGDFKLWYWATGWDEFAGQVVAGVADGAGADQGALSVNFSRQDPAQGGPPVITITSATDGSPVQDPTVRGAVEKDGAPLAGAVVEFWTDDVDPTNPPSEPTVDAEFIGIATTDALGSFEFTPPVEWGETAHLYARAQEYLVAPSGTPDEWNEGDWIDLEVVRADAPEAWLLGALELVYDESVGVGTPRTTVPIVRGSVRYDGPMTDLLVEIDYAGRTEEILISPTADPDEEGVGHFEATLHDLTPDALDPALHTISARVHIPGYQAGGPSVSVDFSGADSESADGWSVLAGYNSETNEWDSAVLDAWFDEAFDESGAWRTLANEVENATELSGGYATEWNEAKDGQGSPIDASLTFELSPVDLMDFEWGGTVVVDPQADSTDPTISGTLEFDEEFVAGMTLVFYLDDVENGRVVTDAEGRFEFAPTGLTLNNNGIGPPQQNQVEIRAIIPAVGDRPEAEATLQSHDVVVYIDSRLAIEANSIALKNPIDATGSVAIDPTLIGEASGPDGTDLLRIEVDYFVNGEFDGEADAVTFADGTGEFEITPEGLLAPGFGEALVNVRLRVGEVRAESVGGAAHVAYGEWTEFEWTANEKTATSVDRFELANDTGPKGDSGATILDRVTSDPTVIGHVAEGRAYTPVELSFDGGQTTAVTVLSDADGWFRYTPDLAPGYHDVQARVVETDPVTGATLVSDWAVITGNDAQNDFNGFLLTAPDAYQVDAGTFGLLNDSQSTLHDPTLTGTVNAAPNGVPYAASGVIVDFHYDDNNGEDRYLGSAFTDANGEFVFLPTGLPFGDTTVTATPRQDDRYEGVAPVPAEVQLGQFTSFHANFKAYTAGPGTQLDLNTLPIAGNVGAYGYATPLYVEIDLGDQVVTTPIEVVNVSSDVSSPNYDWLFSYELDLQSLPAGTTSLEIRPVGFDENGYVFGPWVTEYGIPEAFDFGLFQEEAAATPAVRPLIEGTAARLPAEFNSEDVQPDTEGYVVEFDYDGDGLADDYVGVDDLGSGGSDSFSFSHELSGFAPGTIALNVRVVGYASYGPTGDSADDSEGLAQDLVAASDWEAWAIDFADPAPTVVDDSVDFTYPDEEVGTESTTPRITGQVASPLGASAESLYVEIDEDMDGVADGTALVTGTDTLTFDYTLEDTNPRVFADNPIQIRVIDTLSDTLPLEGAWTPITDLTLVDHSETTVTVDGLAEQSGTSQSELDGADIPVSHAPVLVGSVTEIAVATSRRVEFDHNGDGIVDGTADVDAFGQFRYEPQQLAHGEHTLLVRAVDQIGDRTRVGEWLTSFRFFHDAIETPVVSELSVVDAERGIVEGRATVDGYGASVTVHFKVTPEDGAETAKGQVTTSSAGYFRYELPELAIPAGGAPYTVSVTAAVDDPYSTTDVDGEARDVDFVYTPTAFVTPSLAPPALAFDTGTDNGNGYSLVSDPTIHGQISNWQPQTYLEVIGVDSVALAEPLRVAVLEDGTFKYTPTAPDTDQPFAAGEHSVELQVVAWDPAAGDYYEASTTSTVQFALDPSESRAPLISQLELVDATDASGVPEAAEPVFKGQVTGVGPLGGLAIYFDHNQDGVDDGVAFTKSDGSFYYRADGVEPGDLTQTLDARVQRVDYWGQTFTSLGSIDFRLNSAPLVSEVAYDPDVAATSDSVSGEVYYAGDLTNVEVEYVVFGAGVDLNSPPMDLADYLANYASSATETVGVDPVTGAFTILAPGEAAGPAAVFMRAVDLTDPDSPLRGPWKTLDYTVGASAAAPDITGFMPEYFVVDDGADTDGYQYVGDPTLSGSLGAGGAFGVVEIKVEQVDGDELVTGTEVHRVNADAAGDFSFTPPGLEWNSRYRFTATSIVYDPTTQTEVPSDNPVQTTVSLVQPGVATIDAGSFGHTGDTTIAGTAVRLTGDYGARVQGLRVEISISYGEDEPVDDNPDAYAFTDADGNFSYDIVNASLTPGMEVNFKARVVDWDPVAGQYVEGEYTAVQSFVATNLPDYEINEDLDDEVQMAGLAAAEAERLVYEQLGIDATTNNEGNQVVVTPLGEVRLLHLGNAGVFDDPGDPLGTVFDVNVEGAFTPGAAWFDDDDVTQDAVDPHFFVDTEYTVDLNSLDGVTAIDGVTTTEVAGGDLVTTTIIIANLDYDFALKASIAADATQFASNLFEIEDGIHGIDERLSFDFWITRTTAPLGDADSGQTVITAGSYEAVYGDGYSDEFNGITWSVTSWQNEDDTLSGPVPIQEFELVENLTVDSWIGDDEPFTEQQGNEAIDGEIDLAEDDRISIGGRAGGTIDASGVDWTQERTQKGSSEREWTEETTTTETINGALGSGQSTSRETYTESSFYEFEIYTETSYALDGSIVIDFDLNETFIRTFSLVGSGSVSTGDSTTDSGNYSRTTWDYDFSGSTNESSNASGQLNESPSGVASLDAAINSLASLAIDGSGNSSHEFRTEDPTDADANFEQGSSTSRVEFQSTGSGGGDSTVASVGESVVADGSSNWTNGANVTSSGDATGSFARTVVADSGTVKTVGSYRVDGSSTATSSGSVDGEFDVDNLVEKAEADYNTSGLLSSGVASQTAGTTTISIPNEPSYTVPFRTNQTVDAWLNGSLDAVLNRDADLYGSIDARVDGASRGKNGGAVKTTTYEGLAGEGITKGGILTATSTKPSYSEEYDLEVKDEDAERTGTFSDSTKQTIYEYTFAEGERDWTEGDIAYHSDWESTEERRTLATRSLDGAFADYGAPEETEADDPPLVRKANGAINDSVVTEFSSTYTETTTGTKEPNALLTALAAVQGQDVDYERSTVTTNSVTTGASHSATTGQATLVNDELIRANTATDFDTNLTTISTTYGGGVSFLIDTAPANAETGAKATKSTVSSVWIGGSLVLANSKVENGKTKAFQDEHGVRGSTTALKLIQSGFAISGGFSTTTAKVLTDDDPSATGYETSTDSTVTVFETAYGFGKTTSDGSVTDGVRPEDAPTESDGFTVNSNDYSRGTVTTSWDIKTKGQGWTEFGTGTETNGSTQKNTYDGFVVTSGPATGSVGRRTDQVTTSIDLDAEAGRDDESSNGYSSYERTNLDTDQATTVELSGDVVTVGLAGQGGIEFFLPDGDPTVTDEGGYETEHTKGWRYKYDSGGLTASSWGKTTEKTSGGVNRPQTEEEIKEYDRHQVHDGDTHDIVNRESTKTVTEKHGERGLIQTTTNLVKNSDTEVTQSASRSTTTRNKDEKTVSTFTSEGDQQGDRQTLTVKSKGTEVTSTTTTKNTIYDSSTEFYASTETDSTVIDTIDTYSSSHTLDKKGHAVAGQFTASSVRDEQVTEEYIGESSQEISGNIVFDGKWMLMEHRTGLNQVKNVTHEGGTYFDRSTATGRLIRSQSGEYTKTVTVTAASYDYWLSDSEGGDILYGILPPSGITDSEKRGRHEREHTTSHQTTTTTTGGYGDKQKPEATTATSSYDEEQILNVVTLHEILNDGVSGEGKVTFDDHWRITQTIDEDGNEAAVKTGNNSGRFEADIAYDLKQIDRWFDYGTGEFVTENPHISSYASSGQTTPDPDELPDPIATAAEVAPPQTTNTPTNNPGTIGGAAGGGSNEGADESSEAPGATAEFIDALLVGVSTTLRLEEQLAFAEGLAKGFFYDGLYGTVSGIGTLLYYAGRGATNPAAGALLGAKLGQRAVELAIEYGPSVQALANDLPTLTGFSNEPLSPVTERIMLAVGTIANHAIDAAVAEIDTPVERARVAGRITGAVLFEVALTYATAGVGHVAKAGKVAKLASYLDKMPIPRASQKAILEAVEKAKLALRRAEAPNHPQGTFSITEEGFRGYPEGLPRPEGPFRLLDGDELAQARAAANKANGKIRRDNGLVGEPVDIHEVQPVKFNGSPTDPANKTLLDRDFHRQQVTPWWNRLQRKIENGGGG